MPPGSGSSANLALLRDHPACISNGAHPAARDRRILHGTPRLDSGNSLDLGRSTRTGLADGQNLHSRRVAGNGRGTAASRPGGLGGVACGSDRHAPAARVECNDPRARFMFIAMLVPGWLVIPGTASTHWTSRTGRFISASGRAIRSPMSTRLPRIPMCDGSSHRPDLEGHWNYSAVVRHLVGQRDPVVRIPAKPEPGQLQVLIYDRLGPTSRVATADHAASALQLSQSRSQHVVGLLTSAWQEPQRVIPRCRARGSGSCCGRSRQDRG